MVKTLLLLVALVWPCLATTYYIDYSSGLDSNNGTSKSTPWKRDPYMVGFAGSYTHAAGDIHIFKGGVTWIYSSGDHLFPMIIHLVGLPGIQISTQWIHRGTQEPLTRHRSSMVASNATEAQAP
jgi:hypothetical protein